MEPLKRNKKEILEIRTNVTERKSFFDKHIKKFDKVEDNISL
jgi:hypothetical protein